LAKTAGASYVAPYTEVRTKADLRRLMQFAAKDHTNNMRQFSVPTCLAAPLSREI
jgi:hypothetical protein